MQQKPGLVIVNAHVLTMDTPQPQTQAVAVAQDRILAVGQNDDIQQMAGPDTQVIDAQGLTLLPGFIDRGMRFFLGGSDLSFILAGAKARGDFFAKLQP